MLIPDTIPLALYIHLPWCVRKCPYCDFNSHIVQSGISHAAYIDALIADLEADVDRFTVRRPISSVFIGGGTPSLFSPEAILQILQRAQRVVPFVPGAEITMEANPGTLEHAPFPEYKAAGINRLSLGVQSFSDEQLKVLGRVHDSTAARRAIAGALNAGFDSVNVDLMYGLPEQTVAQSIADVQTAVDQGVQHISHYQLTLEPNTVFAAKPPQLPEQDDIWAMQIECQQLLSQAGFEQYEISAYGKGGARCRHNLNYWNYGDYLGVGAGAHGKITQQSKIMRTAKRKIPTSYMQDPLPTVAANAIWSVDPAEIPFEFVLNGLRLIGGFSTQTYMARTGQRFDVQADPWAEALTQGMIRIVEGRIQPTQHGLNFLNDLQAMFLPEAARAS